MSGLQTIEIEKSELIQYALSSLKEVLAHSHTLPEDAIATLSNTREEIKECAMAPNLSSHCENIALNAIRECANERGWSVLYKIKTDDIIPSGEMSQINDGF